MSDRILAIATFGGPTAVLNATIDGFVEGVRGQAAAVGICDGPEGLVAGRVQPLGDGQPFGPSQAAQPGSWLGAGRRLLTDADLDSGLAQLAARGVGGLAVVGGNGTMACCHRLSERARSTGVPISVIGVPKTIDNDLYGICCSPGFLSAAAFVGQMVADLAFDHRAMRSIEKVRVVETLGRNSGWLALSSLLARQVTGSEPHLVYLPERPFDEQQFLDEVRQQLAKAGRALVVVAEGAAGGLVGNRFETSSFDRPIEGGVARVLAERIRDVLGVTARAEVPGLLQRCWSGSVVPGDRRRAVALGRHAAGLLLRGVSGVMVTAGNEASGDWSCSAADTMGQVDLGEVAGRTRKLPDKWVPASAADGSPEFERWLGEALSGRQQEQVPAVLPEQFGRDVQDIEGVEVAITGKPGITDNGR